MGTYAVYVRGYKEDTSLEDLIIYFQNDPKNVGDVDDESCKMVNNEAVIMFDEQKDQQRVLSKKQIEMNGATLKFSRYPIPTAKKKENVNKVKEKAVPVEKKAIISEAKTIIVTGICTDTTDSTLQLFFENKNRSDGEDIEDLKRVAPDIAHITYKSSEVAQRVAKRHRTEIDGYLLEIKTDKPEVILPTDTKKLYVENINLPTTTEDSLTNYIENASGCLIIDTVFGKRNNALVTLRDIPDMDKICRKAKSRHLEGTELKISQPPLCNSILVTGLSPSTTSSTLELHFEAEKYGGGRILEVLHRKAEGKAVVSFYDPNVVDTLKFPTLDNAKLTIRPFYPFMEDDFVADETEITKTTVLPINPDIFQHISNVCQDEIQQHYGFDITDQAVVSYDEENEELTLSNVKNVDPFKGYIEQFDVEEIQVANIVVKEAGGEVRELLEKYEQNISTEFDVNKSRIILTGKKKKVKKRRTKLEKEMSDLEKKKEVCNKGIDGLDESRLTYMQKLFDLEKIFGAQVKIDPSKGTVQIKGPSDRVDSIKAKALEEYAKLREESVEVSERQLKYLKFGGLQDVNGQIANKKMMVCLGGQDQVTLVSVKSESARQNKQHLLDCIHEVSFTIDDEASFGLLQGDDWSQRKRIWEENGVILSEEGRNVWIIGEKQAVGNMREEIATFVQVNTIVTDELPFDHGINRYLEMYCHRDVEHILGKIENNKLRLMNDDNGSFQIEGTKDGVREAMKELKIFVNTLTHDKIQVKSLGIRKYFSSESGQIIIKGIEGSERCTISFPGDIPRGPQAAAPTTSVLLCSFETRENITMRVFRGDITAHACDILVNAANEQLNHVGGLAAAVVSKGGKSIQDECNAYVKRNGPLAAGEFYRGSAGQLPCENILHVVGPRWNTIDRVKHMDVLGTSCQRILTNASKNKQKIVAFPAVGSGVFGVPKNTCANVMVDSALKWCSNQDGTSSLREIHFVNNDETTATVFLKEFQKCFGSSKSYKEGPSSRPLPSPRRKTPALVRDHSRSKPATKTTATSQNLKISVVIGDISTHKADVLVNTTGEALNLSSNPCSVAFSNQGGPELQKLCNKIGGIKVGVIGETKATGNIQSKRIYHVVCVSYDKGKGEPVLREIIKGCLKKCSDSEYTSIAFPAIGTGVLGFPHAEAAKISFEEVTKYGKKNPDSSLKSVHFVMYHKDPQSINAFQNEAANQSRANVDVVQGVGNRKEQRRAVSDESRGATASAGGSFIKDHKGGVTIPLSNGAILYIVNGDITKEEADVVAHLSDREGSMNSGVAVALIKKGGKKIGKFRNDIGKILLYDTVLTEAGGLNTKAIAHMAGPDRPDVRDIQRCVEKCLEEVASKKHKSVAFPAIGTGKLSIPAKDSAQAMLSTIVGFLQTNTSAIDTVRIVIFDQKVFDEFLNEAEKHLSGKSKEDSPGFFQSIKDGFLNLFNSSASKTEEERPGGILELTICCQSKQAFERVKSKIEKVIQDMTMKEVIRNEHIEELNVRKTKTIERKCAENDIKVEIGKQQITLEGLKENVLSMKSEITSILSDCKFKKYEKEKAELMAESVRWCWLDEQTETWEEYDSTINEKIEKAYKEKEKTVQFELKEGRCEIRFDEMIETNKKNSIKTKVTRKDLKGIALPEYWDTQSKDAQGKEATCDVIQLDPRKHAKEYKKIVDGFTQTGGGSNILKIERIQNPSLFRLYATKKQNMDERDGSKEKILYHGTATSNVRDINQNGLNRNYKGKNGTVHGHGIYFARDASMSTRYTNPDAAGNRSIYVARVAVGQYAQSRSDMIVPPDKPGKPNEKFDSVVDDLSNPSIYVMFYDNEFYPEYLITFR